MNKKTRKRLKRLEAKVRSLESRLSVSAVTFVDLDPDVELWREMPPLEVAGAWWDDEEEWRPGQYL